MARLSPQVLVQFARRAVQQELKWKPTAEHAPPIPDGAVSNDPTEACATLDVRLLQQLGFKAYYDEATGQSAWPVPLGMTPQELYLFGLEHGIVHDTPVSGDILLQRSLRTDDFIHAALVMTVNGHGALDHVPYHDTSTVEGDTDHRGLLARGYTCKLNRRVCAAQGDRFLRWADLSASEKVA
ncbi:MAG: hypothetical protein JWM95_2345 [Gemmatimonadetes bacterium]|nr:hypothetical protein [Gemmatimonadota bacterium]